MTAVLIPLAMLIVLGVFAVPLLLLVYTLGIPLATFLAIRLNEHLDR